ncbi:MAG: hypothetical protein WCT85_06465 [Parachlamydiales bacterium]|jgi:hypothetical protein
MESLWPEIKHIIIRLVTLLILTPVFGYGVLLSIESLIKAWKSNNRKKKWIAITITLLFLSIALGGLK